MIHIIDDEPMIREVLSSFVEYLGFRSMAFKSGRHFLEHTQKENFEPPHMIFSDVNMPGISGLKMIATFKDQYPNIPCCMVTAYETQAHEHLIHNQLHRIIPKPFMLSDIQEALEVLKS